MIPDFNDQGYLPPGIHPASLDEVEARFGTQSELRRVQMDSLRWLIELAKKAGVKRQRQFCHATTGTQRR